MLVGPNFVLDPQDETGPADGDVDAAQVITVRELARAQQPTCVLKGAGSLVADPSGRVAVCPWGNPGMASGGMGDVLSGVAGALLAQGFELATAARLAMCLHSSAADLAAAASGERGLLASDLFPYLRQLLNP